MEVEECLVQGVSATCSYLKRLSNRAVSLGLPVPVASQWSMKGIALKKEFQAATGDNVDKCYNCALSFKNIKSFRILIEPPISGKRQLIAACRGCDSRMQCGFLTSNNEDESMNCTEEVSSPAMSKPTTTPKPSTPFLTRIISESSSQKNRNNKRRGSALEKLMKAEESEADRSLGAFLNSFSG